VELLLEPISTTEPQSLYWVYDALQEEDESSAAFYGRTLEYDEDPSQGVDYP
jgi:hypothetical protein